MGRLICHEFHLTVWVESSVQELCKYLHISYSSMRNNSCPFATLSAKKKSIYTPLNGFVWGFFSLQSAACLYRTQVTSCLFNYEMRFDHNASKCKSLWSDIIIQMFLDYGWVLMAGSILDPVPGWQNTQIHYTQTLT